MNEKIYKTMGRVGGGNIAMGAVLVVVGVATGVLMIVSGAYKKMYRRYSSRKHRPKPLQSK